MKICFSLVFLGLFSLLPLGVKAACTSECSAQCIQGGTTSKATANSCTQAEKEATKEAEESCKGQGGLISIGCSTSLGITTEANQKE